MALDCLSVGVTLHAVYAADGEFYPAEVVAIKKKAHRPVKVHYKGFDASFDAFVSVDQLKNKKLGLTGKPASAPATKTPAKTAETDIDYSGLEKGKRLQVKANDGKYYAAEVVTVSKSKSKAAAPVKIHWVGYTADSDEWVGAESIRSKALTAKQDSSGEGPARFNQSSKITLGYWKIRGLAQAPRVLMTYADMTFENKMFAQTPAPRPIPEKLCKGHPFPDMQAYDDSKKCWFDVKWTVMGDYHSPNLPYLIDGNVKLSETNAILRYIGRKAAAKGGRFSSLMGGTPQEVANNEFMLEKAMDLRNQVVALGYCTFKGNLDGSANGQDPAEFWNKKAEAYKVGMKAASGPTSLSMLEKYIGNHRYFAGKNVTVCDFHMYELLDQQRDALGADIYVGFPKIEAFMKRFGSLPKVKKAYELYREHANNEMSWTTVGLNC